VRVRRLAAWSLGIVVVVVGLIAVSAPVWADDGGSPPPASRARESSRDLTSSVPDGNEVPHVTGLPLQEASDRIEAAGLTITAVSFAHGPDSGKPGPDEVAWCQSPHGGAIAEPDTKVLVIFDDAGRLGLTSQ
jgi:PASTA domain-containing protein